MRHWTKHLYLALTLLLVLVLCSGCSFGQDDFGYIYESQADDADESRKSADPLPDDGIERVGMTVTEGTAAVHDAVTDKCWELFCRMTAESVSHGESVMVSPFSVLTALSMAQEGARGDTLEELEENLGWTAAEYGAWLTDWQNSLSEGDSSRINVANSFWYGPRLKAAASYTERLESAYSADVRPSAFDDGTVQEVNRWCEEATFGMIKKMVSALDPDTVSMLVNAVAFEGIWEEEYTDRQIKEGELFTTEDGSQYPVDLLYSTEDIWLESEMVTGFLKPYKDGYSFLALLPKDGVTVADAVESLDGAAYRRLFDDARSVDVQVRLPEFKASYNAGDVKGILEEMGIRKMFDGTEADLSGMGTCRGGETLYISSVHHSTFIELDRQGTRAAAVTVMPGNATSAAPSEVYQVYLDRPFLYAIIDAGSRLPLFMGAVMNMEG